MTTEINEKLRTAIGVLTVAINDAKRDNPEAKIKLMIAAENPDGSGTIVARLDNAELFEDIGQLIGFTGPTDEDKANLFVNKFLR